MSLLFFNLRSPFWFIANVILFPILSLAILSLHHKKWFLVWLVIQKIMTLYFLHFSILKKIKCLYLFDMRLNWWVIAIFCFEPNFRRCFCLKKGGVMRRVKIRSCRPDFLLIQIWVLVSFEPLLTSFPYSKKPLKTEDMKITLMLIIILIYI